MFARTGTRAAIFVVAAACWPTQVIAQPLFHNEKTVEFEMFGHHFGGSEVYLYEDFSYTMFYLNSHVIQCPLPMIWIGVIAVALFFVAAGFGNWLYGRTRKQTE